MRDRRRAAATLVARPSWRGAAGAERETGATTVARARRPGEGLTALLRAPCVQDGVRLADSVKQQFPGMTVIVLVPSRTAQPAVSGEPAREARDGWGIA